MPTEIAGYLGKLYISTHATPDDLVGNLTNVTVSVAKETMEATTFDSAPWKRKVSGLKEWSGSADMILGPSDATQAGLFDLLDGSTSVYLEFLPKDYTGGPQYNGQAHITSWEAAAPVDGVTTLAIEFEGEESLVETAHT